MCDDGQTKWIYFLIEDDHSLKKYNTIWDKVNTDIKKQFVNLKQRVCLQYKFFLKTKIKSYGDEVTDFYNKEIPKVDFNHTGVGVISLD